MQQNVQLTVGPRFQRTQTPHLVGGGGGGWGPLFRSLMVLLPLGYGNPRHEEYSITRPQVREIGVFIRGSQSTLKTARNRRHMNSMEEGATGIQNELQVNIKTSNIMNVVQGVGRTKDNQTQWRALFVCLFVCLLV